MTRGEVELLAREIRFRCLRSSWSDLVGFWQGVMANLESAYRTAARSTAASDHMSPGHPSDAQQIVRDKLAMALSQLAGEKQVAMWHTEAMEGNVEADKAKGESHHSS